MKQQFEEPILAAIYKAAGYIVVVIGALIAIFWLIMGFAGMGFENFSPIIGFIIAVGILLLTALIALPLFGISQLISYIGKTAFYAENISDSLTLSTYETTKVLGEISRRIEVAAMKSAMKDALQGFKQTPIANPLKSGVEEQSYFTPPPPASRPAPENCDCPECGKTIMIADLKIGDDGITKCPHCNCYFKIEAG